jgi:hypothetical protein
VRNKLIVLLVLALLIVAMPAALVSAQSATNQTWTSSITYYTPSTTSGTLQVDYYGSDGTKYSANPITLQPHKAGSLLIGSVSTVPTPFAGSAVLSSELPIVATYVQFATSPETNNYGRLLYSGFTADAAGSTFNVPTVLYQKFGSTSRIGVQNIETFAIAANMKFYAAGQTTPTVDTNRVIPAQSSFIFMPSDLGLPVGFNGSLVITGKKSDDASTPGRVVAASEETADNGRYAYAFEGVAQGANKIYLASMLCKSGTAQQISYYAIQNAGTTSANVTVKAYNTAGAQVANQSLGSLAAGGKLSTNPCAWGVANNTSGSAVIESTGAPIIAIAKVQGNNGLSTAFVGESAGATKVAAPYIRWSSAARGDFSSYIAIMNVGSGNATSLNITYYDGNGTAVATKALATAANPLPQYVKRNSDPSSAGALNGSGEFGFSPAGGAIEITSNQPVVVTVRSVKSVSLGAVTQFGEDYNGSAVP